MGKSRAGRATNGAPEGAGGWVWFTKEMLCRPNWLKLTVNARRVVDRVCIEHLAHGGTENGDLIVTHKNFCAAGISPRHIADAIREAEDYGWIDVVRGERIAGKPRPSRMSLTWQPIIARPAAGRLAKAATDRWRNVTLADVGEHVAAKKQRRKSRKRKSETTPPIDNSPHPHGVVQTQSKNAGNRPFMNDAPHPQSSSPPHPYGGGPFNILDDTGTAVGDVAAAVKAATA